MRRQLLLAVSLVGLGCIWACTSGGPADRDPNSPECKDPSTGDDPEQEGTASSDEDDTDPGGTDVPGIETETDSETEADSESETETDSGSETENGCLEEWSGNVDHFGICNKVKSRESARTWHSVFENWGDKNCVHDPHECGQDLWLDCDHGSSGEFTVEQGVLAVRDAGSTRIYIHPDYPMGNGGDAYSSAGHPTMDEGWHHSIELTIYVKYLEFNPSGYLQVYMTNHGTSFGDDGHTPPCDCRGIANKILLEDGCTSWYFEKEYYCHNSSQTEHVKVCDAGTVLSDGQWHGIKFVIHFKENGSEMLLENWHDGTDGLHGGDWELMSSFTERVAEKNWPHHSGWNCDPATIADTEENKYAVWTTDWMNANGSVSKLPYATLMWRTDNISDVDFKWVTIREIDDYQ